MGYHDRHLTYLWVIFDQTNTGSLRELSLRSSSSPHVSPDDSSPQDRKTEQTQEKKIENVLNEWEIMLVASSQEDTSPEDTEIHTGTDENVEEQARQRQIAIFGRRKMEQTLENDKINNICELTSAIERLTNLGHFELVQNDAAEFKRIARQDAFQE